MDQKKDKYSDSSSVKRRKEMLIPEEFPEGSFGSPIKKDDPVYGKSTEWKEGQQSDSAYVYPDREQHAGLPRQTPGAHPLHDEKGSHHKEEH